MNGPISAAIAAEVVVILAIFLGGASYVNSSAILAALSLWAGQ